jgi:divalent metal cation (Fe/Co/Zn/Cd) transporter
MPEAMEMEAPARSPLHGRASTSMTASSRASGSRRSSCKSWTLEQKEAGDEDGQLDQSQQVVKCTTQFATIMCVVIAIIKLTVYFMTGRDVVRTSALDSCGDLMANCMVLYTGARMRMIEPKRYPAGQKKFQSIGCLVFSTFMFALMFGNALGNIETLTESPDEVGKEAIEGIFEKTREAFNAGQEEFLPWAAWYNALDNETDKWKKYEDLTDEQKKEDNMELPEGYVWNAIKYHYNSSESEAERKMAEEMDLKVTREQIVELAAEYENEAEQKKELWLANSFLSVCATYKLCLWLYCILYAIPKSGSAVLVALATDKRNDFICTYTVVICTTIAYVIKDSMSDTMYDKVDPLVSFAMSIFIMYSWSQLMVEHMTTLSVPAAAEDITQKVIEAVNAACQDGPCYADQESSIKVYQSSEMVSAEIYLIVKDPDAPYVNVAKTINKLKARLAAEGLERVIVTASTEKQGIREAF